MWHMSNSILAIVPFVEITFWDYLGSRPAVPGASFVMLDESDQPGLTNHVPAPTGPRAIPPALTAADFAPLTYRAFRALRATPSPFFRSCGNATQKALARRLRETARKPPLYP